MRRKTGLAGVIAVFGLAGCLQTAPDTAPPDEAAENGGGLFGGLFAAGGEPPEPQRPTPLARADLVRGDVVVAGPEGYCVDPVTLARRAGRDFAVIASCNILSGGKAGMFVEPMIMTVTVGGIDSAAALPAPSALALQAGQELIGGSTRDGLVAAQLAGGGTEVLEDGDPRYWRGAFLHNGRMIGLALYAPRGSFLAGADGREMLRAVQTRILRLSPEAAPPRPEDEQTAPPPAAAAGDGLFGRLFGAKDLR
ncbi:dihydroxy-acid dehydratase [Salipiger sp. P9]|uniref:dihydroxy-acid dehydratase n=1 Tax=Salipiger pentaromativorans TaxID=2943193 RepID=UPI0021584D0E|nr:dihydroxy-acid dehydratase [Salipiger pentaromativorans]MCR8549056.1 dihydroxy-acid dehydratase [Salipiger pentaromativorans]